VGEDPLAVQRVATELAKRESASAVPFPSGDYQDELARPSTHRHQHTWGIDPVHYVLEAEDRGANPARLNRQWARHGQNGADLIVSDPVNSLRIPWLHHHFADARFVHATLPEDDAIAWTRARSGLPPHLAREHVQRIRRILLADLANVPHETLTPRMPATPLAD
jgi:hypothetical protein